MSAGDSTTQGNPDPAIRREPATSPGHEPALSIEEQRWLLHTPESWLRAILADLFTGQPDDNWSTVGFDPVALWVVRQADGSLRITLRPGEGGEGFFDYRLTMKL
jgi:hypothetical protein